jgi:NitT/TauT family transport system substrate-binding protein
MRYVRLNLDFYHPWANNAGYYVARARGYYRNEGIDLDITSYDPFRDDSLHRLLRGEIEVACNYPQRLMLHVQDGADLVSTAAVNSTTFESLIYDGRRPIRSVHDLEGKTIGTPRSPRVREVLRYTMENAGADPGAVTFREYYPAEPDPLEIRSGKIDAVWGSYWSWEGVLAKREDPHIEWFKAPDLGAPYIHNQILAVRGKTAEEDSDFVRNFLEATRKGFEEAAAGPEAAAEIMVMVAPVFSADEFAAAIRACSKTWNLENWGSHDRENIESYAQWLASRGILRNSEGHLDHFTDRFLGPDGSEG